MALLTFAVRGLEFSHVRIEQRSFERLNCKSSRVRRVNRDASTQSRAAAYPRIGLVFMVRWRVVYRFVQFLLIGVRQLFARALELLDLDFDERGGRGIAAHHPRNEP